MAHPENSLQSGAIFGAAAKPVRLLLDRQFILLACASILCVGSVWLYSMYLAFLDQAATMRSDYEAEQKLLVRREVERAVDYVEYMKNRTEDVLKENIKEQAEAAYVVADGVYRQHKGKMPEEEIKKLIVSALRDVRYNGGRGFIFIADMDGGVGVLQPANPNMEGKSLLEQRDFEGRSIIGMLLDKLRREGDTYFEYVWFKPDAPGLHRKISYVKRFAPYDWYIGTGEYLADVEKDIQREVIERIEKIRFGKDGYIFVGTYDGLSQTEPGKGRNMLEVTDANGVKVVQELIKAAKEGGGFVSYVMPPVGDVRHARKISYAVGVPDWNWYVGAGVYVDDVEEAIDQKRAEMRGGLLRGAGAVVLLLIGFAALALLASRRMSRRFAGNFEAFAASLESAADQSVRVDPGRLDIAEFRTMAATANRMLEARSVAERETSKARALLEAVIDQAPVGVMVGEVVAGGWRATRINREGQRILGLCESRILGRTFARKGENEGLPDAVSQFDAAGTPYGVEDVALAQALLEGREVVNKEAVVRRKDGGESHVVSGAMPLRDAEGNVAAAVNVFMDITDRKKAETELRRLRNQLQTVFDSMSSALICLDAAGRTTQANREAERLAGLGREAILGRPLEEVFPHLREVGELARETLGDGERRERLKMPSRAGDVLRYQDVAVSAFAGADGPGVLVRVDDVTQRARIEEIMVQTEKMLSVGGLAAGMAHEINNPLGVILGALQNLERRLDPEFEKNKSVAEAVGFDLERFQAYVVRRGLAGVVESMRQAALRAARIVRNMLDFSRGADSQTAPCSVPALLDHALELAANDYDLKKRYDVRNICFRREYEPGLPAVWLAETEMEQVFLNVIKNAAQAMAEKEYASGGPEMILRARSEGARVRVEIEDNGPGMDENVRRRVFEPFFTTKSPGLGTGLGLSVSYFIVTHNHRGSFTVDSTPGKGSVFVILLPVGKGEAPCGPDASQTSP